MFLSNALWTQNYSQQKNYRMTVGFVFLSSDSFISNSEILPLILNKYFQQQ